MEGIGSRALSKYNHTLLPRDKIERVIGLNLDFLRLLARWLFVFNQVSGAWGTRVVVVSSWARLGGQPWQKTTGLTPSNRPSQPGLLCLPPAIPLIFRQGISTQHHI